MNIDHSADEFRPRQIYEQVAERIRERIAATVEQARREFASGQTKPMTASEIVGEALS